MPTAGTELAELAGEVGEPLMPWQQYALEVTQQIRPWSESWRWLADTVGLLVARQNGKTRLIKWRIIGELYRFAGRRVLHTAQDRAVPREMFLELAATIGDVPAFHRRVRKIREAAGQETIELRSGAQYRILAPQQDRFRSWPASLVIFDEAREQRDLELANAARPTLRAAPRPQLWYVSNAGDPDSVRLNVVKARGVAAAADPDRDPGMAYLEWSAESDDPYDLEGLRQANPALGYTLNVETILDELRDAEASGDFSGFLTESLCRWVYVRSQSIVPPEAWEACRAPRRPRKVRPGVDRVILGVDQDPEGRHAVLVGATPRKRGSIVVQVLERWEDPDGIDEQAVAADIIDWIDTLDAEAVGYDPFTTGGIAAVLESRFGSRVAKISGTDYVTACSQLVDSVVNARLRHMGDPYLDAQIAAAGRIPAGDAGWRIARKESSQPIPAVMALVRAIHLAYRPRVVPEVL